MLFGNEKLYSIARSAKLGKYKLPPVLINLRDWIHDNYDVNVIYIHWDAVDIGPSKGRPRITIILETDADYQSWTINGFHIKPHIETRVLSKFIEYVEQDKNFGNTEGVFLLLDNFSDECLGKASSTFRASDADKLLVKFSTVPIWKIQGFSRLTVIFFITEKNIIKYRENGICSEISKYCYDGVKVHDEFGYLTDESFRIKFDSKENLDKNYQGSLFYYWR